MAISKHLKHLQNIELPSGVMDVKSYLADVRSGILPLDQPIIERTPAETNKYIIRRNRSFIKIPKRLPQIIAKDKKLLKPFAIYFELKPLYYSSVIKAAKSNYPELCNYLGISINNLRQKIADMVRLGLAWWDKKDLRLLSYEKASELFDLGRYYHRVKNLGKTELTLRYLALHENLKVQEYTITKKIINNEIVNEYLSGLPIEQLKTIASIPESVKSLLKASCYKRLAGAIKKSIELLKRKYQERTDLNRISCALDSRTPNPDATLSCMGVAKLFSLGSPAAGYYWEQKFSRNNLLAISGDVLTIKNGRSALVWDKIVNGENNGVFTKTTKKGKTHYFLRLPNTLKLLDNELFMQ